MSEETQKPRKVSKNGKKKKQSPVIYAAVITVLAVLLVFGLIIGIGSRPAKEEQEPEESLPPVVEEKYDAKENEITSEEFTGTILPETKDAGQEYIDSTLFIGDSNTARFLRTLNKDGKTFTSRTNTIGVVGMGIDAISSLACLDTSMGRLTMPMAVKALQPERVIITFGTNNLNGTSTDATSFIDRYTKQIKAIENAYPSVDIIINSIPPVSRRRDYINVSMTQIDAYNKAIAAMCEKNEWKYLNSAEALKNKDDGYAKDGYLVTDGLHLSQAGMQALFEYIRTHAYITEDDRPKPLAAVPYVTGVPDGLIRINPLNEEEFKGSEGGEEPAPQQTPDENTEEGCKTVGKYWYDNQCNDEPEATPTGTPDETTKEGCNAAKKYWYENTCVVECPVGTIDDKNGGCVVNQSTSVTDPAAECTNNGGTWDGSTCTYPPQPDPATECTNKGGTWDGANCNYPTPDPAVACAQNGGTWDGANCNYPTPDPAVACAQNGGTWDGANCNYPTPDPAVECTNNGGTWDGANCNYSTPEPPPAEPTPEQTTESVQPTESTNTVTE